MLIIERIEKSLVSFCCAYLYLLKNGHGRQAIWRFLCSPNIWVYASFVKYSSSLRTSQFCQEDWWTYTCVPQLLLFQEREDDSTPQQLPPQILKADNPTQMQFVTSAVFEPLLSIHALLVKRPTLPPMNSFTSLYCLKLIKLQLAVKRTVPCCGGTHF